MSPEQDVNPPKRFAGTSLFFGDQSQEPPGTQTERNKRRGVNRRNFLTEKPTQVLANADAHETLKHKRIQITN